MRKTVLACDGKVCSRAMDTRDVNTPRDTFHTVVIDSSTDIKVRYDFCETCYEKFLKALSTVALPIKKMEKEMFRRKNNIE